MTDTLRERVARAICLKAHENLPAAYEDTDYMERYSKDQYWLGLADAADEIAAAIRALKDRQGGDILTDPLGPVSANP